MTLSTPVAFVTAATQHGLMIVSRFDHCKGSANETFGVSHELLSNGVYAAKEIDTGKELLTLLRSYRSDGVVAVDCGANLGTHTISWARHMLGWGSVTAFEPQRLIYYALCGAVVLNNVPNVTANHGAVGREVALLDVPLLDYFRSASFGSLEMRPSNHNQSIGQDVDYTNTTKVPVVSIDSMCFSRLDLMKIDVEGMEIEVLDGAAQTIARYHPVLMVEWPKAGEKAILAWLESAGYVAMNLSPMMVIAFHRDDPVRKHIVENPPEQE